MAINFPSNPTNAQEVTEGNVTYVYNATKGYWESSEASSGGGASIDVLADMTALIAKTGMSNGDQAFVTGNNNLYIYSGTGWYKIATVQNDSPTAITGVSGSYSLAMDGTPTVITAVSTDPDGFPLTWTYSTSGLGSIATVSQTDNVFTITPSTDEADIGTFTLTINATDGVNGAVSANTSITLEFIIQNSQYTTLLATAVDTSDNSSFIDSSTNNHTITVYGDVHTGTFSPYRHGGYSIYFDGSGDYLRDDIIADNLDNTGDNLSDNFTMELWVYDETPGEVNSIIGSNSTGSGANDFLLLNNGIEWLSSKEITFSLTANTWHHLVVEYERGSENYISCWLDGTRVNRISVAGMSFANNHFAFGTEADAGNFGTLGNYFQGYMHDVKISKEALYGDVTSITVPTSPTTPESSNVFSGFTKGYIANNFTIGGNTKTEPFNPYDHVDYSKSLHGGSVYFDGNGDYLRADTALDGFTSTTDPWTMEAWVNPSRTAPVTGGTINDVVFGVNTTAAGDNIFIATTGTWNVGVDENYNVRVQNNAWNHLAVVYNGTVIKVYVNGKLAKTKTWTPSTALSNCNFAIGTEFDAANGGSPGNYYQGYISDIRVLPTEHYTDEFTPPNAPISSTGSVLHIQGTDASIIDKSQSSNLNLFGNTTGSTTEVKFANTKSMYFDGAGDYVTISDLGLSGDLTLEGWFYQSVAQSATYRCVIGASTYGSGLPLRIYTYDSNFVAWLSGAGGPHISGSFTANTWHHVALVRSSGTWTLYIDGVSAGTSTNNGTYDFASTVDWTIGADAATTYPFTGYAQDVRFSNGLARYTANFTPPTEPLKG